MFSSLFQFSQRSENAKKAPVKCEGSSTASDKFRISGAFKELSSQIPLNPAHDAAHGSNLHQWGTVVLGKDQTHGASLIDDPQDNFNHQPSTADGGGGGLGVPKDARGFHEHTSKVEDRIAINYENMLQDEMSLSGKAGSAVSAVNNAHGNGNGHGSHAGPVSGLSHAGSGGARGRNQLEAAGSAAANMAAWQKKLALHHGLLRTDVGGASSSANGVMAVDKPAQSADDIRLNVAEFSDRVQQDDPLDACKYILMEEKRCLEVFQYRKEPAKATKRCVKWADEWQKCRWDQHKFQQGYTYLEDTTYDKKRRPYIFYPDFKSA